MMKRFALTWLLVLIFAVRLLAQNTGVATYNVRNYGAKGDGTTDDTAAIARAVAAAVAYEAANDTMVMVYLPKGTYIVQDASTADTGTTEQYGGIIIPSTTEKIILSGPEATVKIGSNGITTSAIRCFADNCIIEGITVHPNGDAAPYATTPPVTANDYHTKDNSGIELNDCDNSVIRDCAITEGDKSISSYNTGTITYDHDGPDNLSSSPSERVDDHTIVLSGGTFPVWVDGDAAITIAGTRYPVVTRNSSTNIQLGAGNNPGSDLGSTDYLVECYATTSTGENHFFIVNGRRNRIERCLSVDCAFSPFLVSGDTGTETIFEGTAQETEDVPILDNANYITDCTAVNFKGNGMRVNSGRSLFIKGFVCYSLRNDGRSGILIDAGSSVGDLRTERVFLENCELYCNPDGDFDGAASTLKLASAYQVHVKNCKIECGSLTNSVAVRLEDNLRDVFLEDSYIRPNVFFTPASASGSIFQGAISGHADNGSGKVRYTVTGTPSDALIEDPMDGVDWGRELNVRGSGIQQYNGPQEIIGKGTGYIDTERAYVAGTLGSTTYGCTGVNRLKMRNCIVDGIQADTTGATSHYGYWIQNCNAFHVDIEGCTFNQIDRLNVQYGGIFTDYLTDNGWSMFRVVNNKFTFDSDKTCRVLVGANSSTTEFATSGRSIWYGNEKHNKHTGTTLWLNTSSAEREILFNNEGENPRAFRWNAAPASAHVTWAVGDIIWNTAPSGTSPICWICTTAGSPGTWQPIGLDYTLESTVTDVGNVGTGEDNLITYTLPANTLNSEGESLEIEAGFSFANNTNAKQVKMYFGAAAFYASGSSAHQDGGMVLRAVVTRDTSSIAKIGYMVTSSGSNTPFAIATGDASNASADMTATITIKGTGEATSDNDIVMEYLRVRKIPAP